MSFLIDTHAHLDFPELFSKLDTIIQNAKNKKFREYSQDQNNGNINIKIRTHFEGKLSLGLEIIK